MFNSSYGDKNSCYGYNNLGCCGRKVVIKPSFNNLGYNGTNGNNLQESNYIVIIRRSQDTLSRNAINCMGRHQDISCMEAKDLTELQPLLLKNQREIFGWTTFIIHQCLMFPFLHP